MSTRVSVDIAPELPGAWVDRALCAGADPELFFPAFRPGTPQYDRQAAAAKRICRRCPVTAECLAWVSAAGDDHAIAGCTTPVERRRRGYSRTCEHCGRTWTTPRNRSDRAQRYCSRRCYWDARASRTGCGTSAGAARHRRARQPVCDACRLAEQLYEAQRRARIREETACSPT